MKRSLKVLGLTLIGAFASGALGVSVVSAHTPAKFTSGSHWTVLTAEALTNLVATEGETSVTCGKSLTVHASMGTEQETITAGVTAGITTDVVGETGCELKVGASTFPMQAHSNGCHALFIAGGIEDGEVQGQCPEGSSVELTARILGAWRKCMDTQPQTPTVPTVKYTNATELKGGKNVWVITSKSEVQGITYTKTSLCGSGTFHNTHTLGEIKVWGEDTAGNPVDVTWDPTKAA